MPLTLQAVGITEEKLRLVFDSSRALLSLEVIALIHYSCTTHALRMHCPSPRPSPSLNPKQAPMHGGGTTDTDSRATLVDFLVDDQPGPVQHLGQHDLHQLLVRVRVRVRVRLRLDHSNPLPS